MKNIEIALINDASYSEKMMVTMARLTQRGEKITCMQDFFDLLGKPYTNDLVTRLAGLPHPGIQKFGTVTAVIVGASRRFLAQMTRHQNDVKFMSGSLQYSDWSNSAQFVVPYEITRYDHEHQGTNITGLYLQECQDDLHEYEQLAKLVGRDAAGYKMPQGMRNVLVIDALPFQWRYMIGLRICRRNTLETQYVMMRIWEQLCKLSPMFNKVLTGCLMDGCIEADMTCGTPLLTYDALTNMRNNGRSLPAALIADNFPLLLKG